MKDHTTPGIEVYCDECRVLWLEGLVGEEPGYLGLLKVDEQGELVEFWQPIRLGEAKDPIHGRENPWPQSGPEESDEGIVVPGKRTLFDVVKVGDRFVIQCSRGHDHQYTSETLSRLLAHRRDPKKLWLPGS